MGIHSFSQTNKLLNVKSVVLNISNPDHSLYGMLINSAYDKVQRSDIEDRKMKKKVYVLKKKEVVYFTL